MAICKNPIHKNESKYQDFLKNIQNGSFINEGDFNAQVDDIFFNQPEDFILAMNIATTYEEVVKDVTRIPIGPPYVKIVLSDYIFNGYCAVVSYDSLNKFLIKQGEANANENDFTFYHIIYFNVSIFC